MTVVLFNTPHELDAFLVANSVTKAMIASIYFDSASGKHVLVWEPP